MNSNELNKCPHCGHDLRDIDLCYITKHNGPSCSLRIFKSKEGFNRHMKSFNCTGYIVKFKDLKIFIESEPTT
jgi:hypothetical protein